MSLSSLMPPLLSRLGVALAPFVAPFLALVLGLGLALGQERCDAADRRLRVVATTTVVADLVRQIAGDRVDVDCLMAAGIDPHSYKATPRDADRLARADLVVASGLHLEGKLADLLERLSRRVPLIAVADAIPPDRLLDAGAGLHDPHVWFDAELWSLGVPAVAERLAKLDPPHAEAYREAGRAYAERLVALDGELRESLAEIPLERRVMVTAHDAFRYFGRAYGIEVVGIQGTSTESEAGLGDINRLVDLVVTRRLPAVFVETSVSDRNVTALREGAGARGHTVGLGGRLYSDSLDAPGSGAGTLEEALRANVATIVSALAKPAPARSGSK
jgi:manganese/zinc/iron transport system substrate-binding protein